MSEISQIVAKIKTQLKAQGLNYQAVARALKLSEASVKRMFASERFTIDRLAQISQILGYTMAELLQETASSVPKLQSLTREQEAKLVADEKLLLVTVCALNHLTVSDITSTYQITKPEVIKRLLVLDKMGVIDLLPHDRIRLRVQQNFEWIPNGPIRKYFLGHGMRDFLDSPFALAGESLEFAHGMLTANAIEQIQTDLQRLKQKLTLLHRESNSSPRHLKHGVALLMACRPWEPKSFRALRHAPAIQKREKT